MAPKEGEECSGRGEECSQRGAREEQESLQSPKEERAARTRKEELRGTGAAGTHAEGEKYTAAQSLAAPAHPEGKK